MTLRQLLEKRASLQTELRSLHEAAPDAALAGDAKVKWDTLTAGLDTLQSQIDRQSILDDLDRRSSSGVPLDGSGSSGAFEQLAAKVTAADVLAALLGGKDERCGRAIEVSAELARRSGVRPEGLLFSMSLSGAPPEKRVFSTTTPPGGPGSALIETTVAPGMIDRLRERIIVRSLGATVLSGLQGNLSIPRLKQDATAYWVGENQDITHSDPMTEGVPMSPKHVGAICEISRNMILQPSLDVARFIEDMLAKVIAIAFDRVALKGGGTNEPHGLLDPFSAIPVVGKGGAAISWNDVINLIGTVDAANALGDGSAAFVTNAALVSKLRRTPKTVNDTASNFIMNDPTTLAGYRLANSQVTPTGNTIISGGGADSTLLFGDFSQLCLGFWSELDLRINDQADSVFSKGNALIRAMSTGDVAILQPGAFAAIMGAATA